MNNERYNQIIDEVYKSYVKHWEPNIEYIDDKAILSQDDLINKIKTDDEFSEKWKLKIEEIIVLDQVNQNNPILKGSTTLYSIKLIKLTYGDEKIEIYE